MRPKQTEHVIAKKQATGRVIVHNHHESTEVTLCGNTPDWGSATWLWLEFRTLNPDRVVLCKLCWR